MIGAEVVSLDSMTVYRQMNIGTAKPTPEEQNQVPHHLLDIVEPDQEFNLAQYVERAHETIAQIKERGREVLFVGGTPLYLKALLRGLFEGPPADWQFREQIQREAREVGNDALYERLTQVDPLAASKLHPHDTRRIIRALEVQKITGQPISHLQEQFDEGRPAEQCRVFVLEWSKETLHARIETRVQQMFDAGFVDEVRHLLKKFKSQKYKSLSRTAMQAVGYREVAEHLAGQRTLEETVLLVTTRTRQFAKRQNTWFRSLSECRSIEMTEPLEPEVVAQQIFEQV